MGGAVNDVETLRKKFMDQKAWGPCYDTNGDTILGETRREPFQGVTVAIIYHGDGRYQHSIENIICPICEPESCKSLEIAKAKSFPCVLAGC